MTIVLLVVVLVLGSTIIAMLAVLIRSTATKVAAGLETNIAEARQQFSRLVILLDQLQYDVAEGVATGARIEAEGVHVAEQLADVQAHARIIEAKPEFPTGSAADFAAGGNERPLPRVAERKGPRRKPNP